MDRTVGIAEPRQNLTAPGFVPHQLDLRGCIRGEERHRSALTADLVLTGADLVSSELVLTDVPRAIRRRVAQDPRLILAGLRTMSPGV